MLESLFDKVAGLKVTFIKRDSNTSVSREFSQIFKSIFFYRTPLVAEGTSLVKILQSCNFNKDAHSEK